MLNEIQKLNEDQDPDSRPNTDIVFHARKICIRTSAPTSTQVEQMLSNPDHILSLFAEIQSLLKTSSLDETIEANSGKRYDHMIDQPNLPQIDANDTQIAQVAKKLA